MRLNRIGFMEGGGAVVCLALNIHVFSNIFSSDFPISDHKGAGERGTNKLHSAKVMLVWVYLCGYTCVGIPCGYTCVGIPVWVYLCGRWWSHHGG